jgi:dienelactone hydrolase
VGRGGTVSIAAGERRLAADLDVPEGAKGVVVFAHGSGSGRESPRNRSVARALWDGGFATLLLDLLTPEEDAEDQRTRRLRFDVALLGERVVAAIDWLAGKDELAELPVGCFGASTGAAAALLAAAARPGKVGAVVSRGGRPDLAGNALGRVAAPTLLVVGGRDQAVLGVNRSAMARMAATAQLAIVQGATHLFEEPGALDCVADHATDWFVEHFTASREPGRRARHG